MRFDRLSQAQQEALNAVRAVHDSVRWAAVELNNHSVEMTLWYVDEEAQRSMRVDPDTVYCRRMVVVEDGSVRVKEMVAL